MRYINSRKNEYLQIIRALAFLGIFLSHTGISCFSACGAWGVSVFFILSGFVMMYGYWGNKRVTNISVIENIKFSFKKIRKLYILHILMLISEIILLIPKYINNFEASEIISDMEKIFLNVLLLQAWNINEEIYFSMNGVSWYLSVCVFLYFCFPWILRVIGKYRNRKIANIAMIMTWGGQIIISYLLSILPVSDLVRDSFIHWGVYICPLMRFGDFFIGCNLGYLFLTRTIVGKEKLYKSNETGKKDFFVLAIIIIQWIVHIYYSNKLLENIPHPETWWMNAIFFTWSSCCLIYLFAQKDRKNLGKYQRILVYVGNISSYTFLVH